MSIIENFLKEVEDENDKKLERREWKWRRGKVEKEGWKKLIKEGKWRRGNVRNIRWKISRRKDDEYDNRIEEGLWKGEEWKRIKGGVERNLKILWRK